jgi:hypothetical protein
LNADETAGGLSGGDGGRDTMEDSSVFGSSFATMSVLDDFFSDDDGATSSAGGDGSDAPGGDAGGNKLAEFELGCPAVQSEVD